MSPSHRRFINTCTRAATVLVLVLAWFATARPVAAFDLAKAVARSEVIAIGQVSRLGVSSTGRNGQFVASVILRGTLPPRVDIDFGRGIVPPSCIAATCIAFIAARGKRYETVSDTFAVIPALPVGSPSGVPVLDKVASAIAAALAASPNDDARAIAALVALSTFDSKITRRALDQELTSRSAHLRLVALSGLMKWGDAGALGRMLPEIMNPAGPFGSDRHYIANAIALGHWGPDAVLALSRLEKSTSPALRAAAAQALGNSGSRRATPILAALLGDTDFDVRYQAVRSLEIISGGGPISADYFRQHEASLIAGWRTRTGG